MRIVIPDMSLVALVGASGSGKSTFAAKHFLPTEVVSSDRCRGLVSDDETDQSATEAAFDVLFTIARKRLERGRTTVIDATNVQAESRKKLLALAREHDVLAVAIVFRLPERVCFERNARRGDRNFGMGVIQRQTQALRQSLRGLQREGFRYTYVLEDVAEVEAVEIERRRLWTDRKDDSGPFDLIGDVHGCALELRELLETLGYVFTDGPDGPTAAHPAGRKAVFVGDLVDRGPGVAAVLRLAMNMVAAGSALCVPGNHEERLLRKLNGRDVGRAHGLAETLDQLAAEPPEFTARVRRFLDDLVSHYVLDGGRLIVAHAGMKAEYAGRASGRVRTFALYGPVTNEKDSAGLTVRVDWAEDYRGQAKVVYGHTPVGSVEWLNNTLNIDTGCVFGGRLTALRYPELDIVSVPAREKYCPGAIRPGRSARAAEGRGGDLLDLADVVGRHTVSGGPLPHVALPAENAPAALELLSRFAVAPTWLIHLPPTMSPPETSRLPGHLEHPQEVFDYFRREGVGRVVCQEKHMGSRTLAIVCRDEAVAARRFGGRPGETGILHTRTGRRFFDDSHLEREFLDVLRRALDRAGWWDRFESDWFLFDGELLPWSAKALELVRRQYAAVGAAATTALALALPRLEAALARLPAEAAGDLPALATNWRRRRDHADRFVAAYRRYCGRTEGLRGLKFAPFHLLAAEGKTFFDRDHLAHMAWNAELAAAGADDGLLLATRHRDLDPADPEAVAEAVRWWEELTAAGGEGMVIKPLEWIVRGPKGLVQPGVKCRGREYLRIIYGPDYDLPENLERLRKRGLGAKRALALREFSLGFSGLERFVAGESLRRVHECVFGVASLESEPVDPRL